MLLLLFLSPSLDCKNRHGWLAKWWRRRDRNSSLHSTAWGKDEYCYLVYHHSWFLKYLIKYLLHHLQLSGKWYLNDLPEKEIYECVRECPGRSPCNGRAPLNQKLFDTFADCCQERTWWKQSCSSSLLAIINPSECSDTFWDTYRQWDQVGYYPVCKFQPIGFSKPA